MRGELAKIARSLWAHVSEKGFSGRTFTLKVKSFDFRSVTRRVTGPTLVRGEEALLALACELITRTDALTVPVRLLGISLSNLGPLVEGTVVDLSAGDDEIPDDDAFG